MPSVYPKTYKAIDENGNVIEKWTAKDMSSEINVADITRKVQIIAEEVPKHMRYIETHLRTIGNSGNEKIIMEETKTNQALEQLADWMVEVQLDQQIVNEIIPIIELAEEALNELQRQSNNSTYNQLCQYIGTNGIVKVVE